MMPKFKQNAAALKRQVSAEFNSRNILDPTQLIAYDPDEKVHTNFIASFISLVFVHNCKILYLKLTTLA